MSLGGGHPGGLGSSARTAFLKCLDGVEVQEGSRRGTCKEAAEAHQEGRRGWG